MNASSISRKQVQIDNFNNLNNKNDNIIRSYQNQINKTRGKLGSLAGKNNHSLEEKRNIERQLKQEIGRLDEQIRQHKADQQKEVLGEQVKKVDTENNKVNVEPPKELQKPFITDKQSDQDKDIKTEKKDIKEKKDNNKNVDVRSYSKTEENKKSTAIDAEVIRKLVHVQSKKDNLAVSNSVDKRIEYNHNIEMTEIKTDKMRGRDTALRENRIENINIDVSKISKKYFSKNIY